MQTPLSDPAIKTLPPGTHWDTHTKGLGLRVGKSSRTFIVLIKSGQRKTLGRYPHMTLGVARKECARMKAEVTLGKIHNPRIAYDDAVAAFLSDIHVRPRTLKNYTDYLAFFPYHRRALADITARDILASLRPHTRSQKEQAHRVARNFYRWCIRQHLLDRSPVERLSAPLGRARARVLTEDELRAVWTTARSLATPFHAILSLLVLTGQRRGEIAALQWDWIKGDRIEFPATVAKNHRAWTVPIGPEAQTCFRSVTKMVGSPYVFPALRKRSERTTVMNGWSRAKADFDKECGVTGWTLHDLRRTFATNLQRLGVRLEVTEALLNHVSGSRSGIVGVYQQHQWADEKREAIQRFEAYLTNLSETHPT